jgi:HNH endonuclease
MRPVGHCIYCGQVPSDQPLTDEHIIPFSLGGELLLPASSCRSCAAITGHIEGIVCGSMLKAVRTHFGMKSRRPKKSTLPVKGSAPTVEVPINDHPFYLVLEVFERPQILKRSKHWSERDIPTGHYDGHLRMYADPHSAKRHDTLGNAGVPIKITPGNLQTMLAKMAHSYAIAELGSDVFRPFLPDLILNKRPSRNWLVDQIPLGLSSHLWSTD